MSDYRQCPHDIAPERTWPDTHVVLQDVISPAPEYSIPFAVHVFVFDTIEHLREACATSDAHAHSMTYDEPDDANIGAIVMLVASDLHLSLVAHEATHIALNHHTKHAGNETAEDWLADHPESVAEMIGNLTALIWYRVAS